MISEMERVLDEIIFTPQMKEYLRQQMVFTDSELKYMLVREKEMLRKRAHNMYKRIQDIDSQLVDLASPD